ncbi:MAG: AAA family ATPase [Dehalococcoidia bacterium]|nr:AAA family ATPase [Dehalococcoidia bacterium]MSQ16217.1 AAA family ATPase [Dehalococcoidia bacterium]
MIPTPGLEVLQGLNPAQRQAVESIDGPLLIIAGPGSGKTRVITHRIAYLVRVCGVSPYRILAVTFTNKAAREMRSRLERLVGSRGESLSVGTFHAFCARLLRSDGAPVGVQPNYTIYDTDDQLGLIKQGMELAELDPKRFPPQAVLAVISKAKSVLWDSEALARQKQTFFEERCAQVYRHYQELLGRNNALDFDDLLMRSVQLLQNSEEAREKYQQRFQYVLVDEFQDTNVAQYRLARLLAEGHRNICVVGDPDQSIYSWRSADIRNILSFKQDYPKAKTIALEQNYRSTSTILEAAKRLISVNGMRLEKDLFTENDKGAPVVVHEAYNQEEEAEFVVGEISRLVRQEHRPPGDCAVMYRVNAQSRALEEACLRLGIKYRLVGGVRFYQRREIKELLAYLRLLHNPLDEVNLSRVINVPPRGIGAKSVQELVRWAQELRIPLFAAIQRIDAAQRDGLPCPAPVASRAAAAIAKLAQTLDHLVRQSTQLKVVELIDQVVEQTGLRQYIQGGPDRAEERWENILELRETAREFDAAEPPEGLASLLERLSLVADVDGYEETEDSVTLITLHQAKGLEFPVVFIVGLEEGLLPHNRSLDDPAQLEEERRLCYVGITRARERLYLLRAFRRGFMGGNSGPTIASRFLREIPQHLLASPAQSGKGTAPQRSPVVAAMTHAVTAAAAPAPVRPALQSGNLVRHTSFGEGVVLSCVAASGDHEVTIQFRDGVGVKRLLLSYAPLERLEG